MLDIIILAAGKGTRMKSSLPKVLHSIGGKPLLAHVLTTAQALGNNHCHIVVGHGVEHVKATFSSESNIHFIEQKQQLGTGHAVQQVLPEITANSISLILYGDVPLISHQTLSRLINKVEKNTLGLLTVNLENPTGYGRIVRDGHGKVTSIVEQKDASEQQLAIKEVNTGIMAVNSEHLMQWLPHLSNANAQGEYYLTDIIAMAAADEIVINTEQPNHEWEVLGVNNRQQQVGLERIFQKNCADQLMVDGVTLLDPNRFDNRGQLSCGSDVVIDVNCVFEGENTLGNNVSIGPNCVIKNTVIGDNTVVHANSILENSQLANKCTIGPFARLRPGTELSAGAKIGNFVEIKKSSIGVGSKVNHLSYVGDTTLGSGVNIGAGTITCNYDGVNKHQTTIGDDVVVGSNTALVAPVSLEDGSTIGAGSTITKSVEKDCLALSRSKQTLLKSWVRPTKNTSK